MDVAIIGSRGFDDYTHLEKEVHRISKENDFTITKIISGGAIGTDRLAEMFAQNHNIPITVFKPEWSKFGKGAGIIRNTEIVASSDIVIAFWDGQSKGTDYSIKKCKQLNKSLFIVAI